MIFPERDILEIIVESGELGLITTLAFGGFILLHYFFFQECAVMGKSQVKRLTEIEQLIKKEVRRSQSLPNQPLNIRQLKAKTDEKLELIKLQDEAMKKRKEISKSD